MDDRHGGDRFIEAEQAASDDGDDEKYTSEHGGRYSGGAEWGCLTEAIDSHSDEDQGTQGNQLMDGQADRADRPAAGLGGSGRGRRQRQRQSSGGLRHPHRLAHSDKGLSTSSS